MLRVCVPNFDKMKNNEQNQETNTYFLFTNLFYFILIGRKSSLFLMLSSFVCEVLK